MESGAVSMKVFSRVVVMAALLPFGCACAGELETARAALRDKLYEIAQAHAERALRDASLDASQTVEAFALLLETLAAQKRPDAVLEVLASHGDLVRRASTPDAFVYWRAWAELEKGHPADALLAAEQRSAAPTAYTDALRRICARAKRAVGDLPGALALYAAVDKGSTNRLLRAENALEWAQELDESGRPAEALDVLKGQSELGVQTDAASQGALLRGRLLLRLGKSSDATLSFNKLAMDEHATEPARVQALLEMSVHAFGLAKTNEAVAYARSAYERATQPETRRLSGFRLGDLLASDAATIDEGERIVKALVREFPESVDSQQAQLKLADSLLQVGRPERAAAEYRIFLETYPSSSLDSLVLQGRGWALFQLGRYAEASSVFLRASELATNDDVRAECRFKQGDALLADSRYAEAAAVYTKLAETRPLSAYGDRALFQSADCLYRAGLRDEACARYRQVASTYPDREVAPKALLRLAAVQTEASSYDEAVQTYASILESFTQKSVRAEAWMGRGKVHFRMYRFDAAMQDFASVAETDPARRDEARYLLAHCLYGLGRDKEARAAGTSFLLEFPESKWLPDMYLWLGKFDFNHGKFEDARRFFLEYVTRWPGNTWADAALLWAARAAFAAADFTDAVEGVARLVREYPQSVRLSEARLLQVDALMELARFDEAVLLLDPIIAKTQDGHAEDALFRKGDCLFAMGANNGVRYKEALYTYRELLLQENLSPLQVFQLHYKVARCLEKLKRVSEAIDEYYSEVIIRYQDERARGSWLDETCTSLYVRAVFNVAELYEQKGQPEQAVRILQRLLQPGVPGEEEARLRIERLKRKHS